jgi:hypothetical protein
VIINNISNVCSYIGTNQTLTYTASVAGASSYAWTLPPNTQLVSGQGTRSIQIKILNGFAAQTNKQIRVTPAGGSIQVIYPNAQAPVTPAPIIASKTNICNSLGTNVPVIYSIPKVVEATTNAVTATAYIWSAQNGTTNISHPNGDGVNDTTISVTFEANFSSSTLTVQALNACGTSGTRTYFINRSNPSTPSIISGPTNACEYIGETGQSATYFVNAVAGVETYTWTLPVDATNVTGQGTNTVSFKYPAGYTTGTISVIASNGCGISAPRALGVNRLTSATPNQIDVINVSGCPDRVYTYSISAIPSNATSLLWSVPVGATLVSGQGTRSITVSYSGTTIDGNVIVQAINNCSLSGARVSKVKLGACASGVAGNTFTKVVSGSENWKVNVYPNPTTTSFNMQVTAADSKKLLVRILDIQGRVIKTFTTAASQTNHFGNELKSGVYMVEVTKGLEKKVVRVVKY